MSEEPLPDTESAPPRKPTPWLTWAMVVFALIALCVGLPLIAIARAVVDRERAAIALIEKGAKNQLHEAERVIAADPLRPERALPLIDSADTLTTELERCTRSQDDPAQHAALVQDLRARVAALRARATPRK
jgi:hypothetical protein